MVVVEEELKGRIQDHDIQKDTQEQEESSIVPQEQLAYSLPIPLRR